MSAVAIAVLQCCKPQRRFVVRFPDVCKAYCSILQRFNHLCIMSQNGQTHSKILQDPFWDPFCIKWLNFKILQKITHSLREKGVSQREH